MTRPGDAAPLEENMEQQIARLASTVWVVECTTTHGAKFEFRVGGIELEELMKDLQEYQREKQVWTGMTYFVDLSQVCFVSVRKAKTTN